MQRSQLVPLLFWVRALEQTRYGRVAEKNEPTLSLLYLIGIAPVCIGTARR